MSQHWRDLVLWVLTQCRKSVSDTKTALVPEEKEEKTGRGAQVGGMGWAQSYLSGQGQT